MISFEKKASAKKVILFGIILCVLTGLFLLFASLNSKCTAESINTDISSLSPPTPEIDPQHKAYGSLADIKIQLQFDDSTEILDIKTIGDWVKVKNENGVYNYDVDSEKVSSYTNTLAEKYSNYQSYVTFTTHYGEEVTLENNSTGWIFDADYAANMLTQYITDAQSVKLNLTDKSKASNQWWVRISSDYSALKKKGDSYAEVSIDSQYMWLYKNGKVILEGPVVTGDPNLGNDTPTGAFFVYEKKSPATLYGPGYLTEVSYWMAFNDDIGFHDAVWQDDFGGDNYLSNGSHGCVNLPLSFAEELYSKVYVYMPVYVY